MATKYVNIVGKCAWAYHLFVPDEGRYGRRWMIDVYPTDEGMEVFKESGIELRPIRKPFFDGEVGYRFRRDVEKEIKGVKQTFTEPVVVDADGKPWPNDVRIGNGSLVEINVAVYQTRGGDGPNGHRLQGAKILELVPYEPPTAEETAEAKPSTVKTNISPRVKSPW